MGTPPALDPGPGQASDLPVPRSVPAQAGVAAGPGVVLVVGVGLPTGLIR